MTLINTDGMAFIGPGSEWFWTALTGIVLAVTFIAIFRQLRIQAHATAVEQIEAFRREWSSEQMNRCVLDLLVALRDSPDPAQLPIGPAYAVAEFWETFATMARTGHRDVELLWHWEPAVAQQVWAGLAPWIYKRRADTGSPRFMESFEWLAGQVAAMDRRTGAPAAATDPERSIADGIAIRAYAIRTAEASRGVTREEPLKRQMRTHARPAGNVDGR